MNTVNATKSYWYWLCDQFHSDTNHGRFHGELFTAIVDRLRGLGVNVNGVIDELQIIAAELEKCVYQLNIEMKELAEQKNYTAADVKRGADILELKRATKNLKNYATLLDEATFKDFALLKELSGNMFKDLERALHMIHLLQINTNQIELCAVYVKHAVSELLADFKAYILTNYTDYFNDFYPVRPIHLGYMVQCAAILESGFHDECSNDLIFPARMYNNLLNWFNED